MFWFRKEKPAEPFNGSAFNAALRWCQEQGEQVSIIGADAFDVQLGDQTVHVQRHPDDVFLHAYAVLPEPPLRMGDSLEERVAAYEALTDRQFRQLDVVMDVLPDGRMTVTFTKLMQFQGSVHWFVFNMLSTFDMILNNNPGRLVPPETAYFYVNGKKFYNASEALIHYFKYVRREPQVEVQPGYVSFKLNGPICGVSREPLSHEFVMRFAFPDFEKCYSKSPEARMTGQLFTAAYRKFPGKTASYLFRDGIAELAISGVLSEGTEARPVFTRTLAEIYQVVLDSTERIQMNLGLLDGSQVLQSEEESMQQAALYHGDKTGGAV